MSDVPTTQPSLLMRLRDPADGDAWGQFVRLYAPVVYAYARGRQLQDADAADLTQDVLRSVSLAAPRFHYDPTRGSFRSWLFTVTRNKLSDWRERRQQGQAIGGTTAHQQLHELPGREDESLWDEEFRRQVFTAAAEQVRREFEETTWQAFRRTAVEGAKPAEVAQSLGISVGAVYIARSRVQTRLKARIAELSEYI